MGQMKDPSAEAFRARGAILKVDDVTANFRQNYSDFQYTFVQFFTEHLADLSRCFKGDLSEMLILAVIGQAGLSAHNARSKDAPPPEGGTGCINASRISDVTGIPRQTVRRKLEGLERRGWIVRNDDAEWSIRGAGDISAARRDLQAINDRALARVALLFVKLAALAR